MTDQDRRLRVALRARGRALGEGVLQDGEASLNEEIAYEQWHRMLFARFLAENDLLLHPEGAALSLEVRDDSRARSLRPEAGRRSWVLAARYAAAMLPGIFRADDPANAASPFAPEDRSRLEAFSSACRRGLHRRRCSRLGVPVLAERAEGRGQHQRATRSAAPTLPR